MRILDKIFFKLGYVQYDPVKEELYEAARESYRRKQTLTVKGRIWTFKINVVEPWEI